MKFKKFAAVVMAAVMSLVMLTACSGGSALVTPRDCKEYTLQAKAVKGSYSSYQTTDGKWLYSTSGKTNAMLIDRTAGKEYSITYDEDGNITDVKESSWKASKPTVTTGKGEYNNKSYKTKVYKIVEVGGVRTETYLFDGTTLKYIELEDVLDDGTKLEADVYEVQKFTRTTDTAALNKTKEAMENWLAENGQK